MKTFKIVDLEQNSTQWKNWRKLKITASMAPTIMGENKYETPLALWERIINDIEIPDNIYMARGREFEGLAREYAVAEKKVNYQPVCIESLQYPHIAASLDGYAEKDGVSHVLEIKCPSSNSFDPMAYNAQLQHQMMVAGVDMALMLVYSVKDHEFIPFERDEEYCEYMLKKEQDFYKKLIELEAPEACERDYVVIENAYLNDRSKEYLKACAQLDEMEQLKKSLRDELISACSHNRCKIGNLRLDKIAKKGLIDYGAIEILKTINLEIYRKKRTEMWRITGEKS